MRSYSFAKNILPDFGVGGRMSGFFNHPAKIDDLRQTTIPTTQTRFQFKGRMRAHSLAMHVLGEFWGFDG